MKQIDQPSALISPVSLYESLCLLSLGAQGKTVKELIDVLQLDPRCDLIPQLKTLSRLLNKESNSSVKLSSNNFLLHRDSVPITSSYRTIFKMLGGHLIPFNQPIEAVSKTNQIVDQLTHGLIPQVLNQGDVDGDLAAILLNVIYFKTLWLNKFDLKLTHEEPFYTLSGQRPIPMMHQTDTYQYAEDSEEQIYNNPIS